MSNFFNIFAKIAEERIKEAMERGEFDNLSCKGKPIEIEDDSHIPPELRIAHKILKNAGCLPLEMEIKKEIKTTEELLAGIKDTQEKYRQIKKLNYLVLKLNMMKRRTSPLLEEGQYYYEKVLDKVAPPRKKDDKDRNPSTL